MPGSVAPCLRTAQVSVQPRRSCSSMGRSARSPGASSPAAEATIQRRCTSPSSREPPSCSTTTEDSPGRARRRPSSTAASWAATWATAASSRSARTTTVAHGSPGTITEVLADRARTGEGQPERRERPATPVDHLGERRLGRQQRRRALEREVRGAARGEDGDLVGDGADGGEADAEAPDRRRRARRDPSRRGARRPHATSPRRAAWRARRGPPRRAGVPVFAATSSGDGPPVRRSSRRPPWPAASAAFWASSTTTRSR